MDGQAIDGGRRIGGASQVLVQREGPQSWRALYRGVVLLEACVLSLTEFVCPVWLSKTARRTSTFSALTTPRHDGNSLPPSGWTY